MKRFVILLSILLLLCGSTAWASDFSPADSAQKVKSTKQSNTRFTTRLHSLGQFSFGGRIVSENPVLDFNLQYDRRNWGIQIFKAMDLRDHNTQINFTLAVVNRPFHIGKRLSITPSAGFLLEQSNSVADHGSDFAMILTTAYRISGNVTLDHSALMGNLLLEPGEMDWVNRFRIMYTKKHFDFGLLAWHNNKVFDAAEYVTFGASAFYSRVRLSSVASMNFGISGVVMPYSNDLTDYPKKNGINFTVVLVLD